MAEDKKKEVPKEVPKESKSRPVFYLHSQKQDGSWRIAPANGGESLNYEPKDSDKWKQDQKIYCEIDPKNPRVVTSFSAAAIAEEGKE